MALRTQTNPFVLVGNIADLPPPGSVAQGMLFHAEDTLECRILVVDSVSRTRRWDPFCGGAMTGPTGPTGPAGATGATGPAGGLAKFAMYFGLTTGTGNGGATDYPATIAAGARVPFPRNGPAQGTGMTRVDASSFTLPDVGTYSISYRVQTTEPGQLELQLNGVELPETLSGNQNPTAGGHPIQGISYITTTVPNSVIAVINPPGNTPVLTVTPADGASTHANSQRLTISRIS